MSYYYVEKIILYLNEDMRVRRIEVVDNIPEDCIIRDVRDYDCPSTHSKFEVIICKRCD